MQQKCKDKNLVTGPGTLMDDFISAGLHVRCRHRVVDLYFGNDHRKDKPPQYHYFCHNSSASHACLTAPHNHTLCNSRAPKGCLRCAPSTPTACCDLCNPGYFKKFDIIPSILHIKIAGKSHVKLFDMTPTCKDLCRALFGWWQVHAVAMFGESVVEMLGAKLLVPDEVVEQLISCSQAFKIMMVHNITKETGWTHEENWVEELSDSLLTILHTHFPLPIPEETLVTAVKGTVPARQKHCTACGASDHIHKYYSCSSLFLDPNYHSTSRFK